MGNNIIDRLELSGAFLPLGIRVLVESNYMEGVDIMSVREKSLYTIILLLLLIVIILLLE